MDYFRSMIEKTRVTQKRLDIMKMYGITRSKKPKVQNFDSCKFDCKFIGKKQYTKYGGGFYLCSHEGRSKYYCNYKYCPRLFNRNQANETN